MILNCRMFRKLVKGLMFMAALLMMVPVEAREQGKPRDPSQISRSVQRLSLERRAQQPRGVTKPTPRRTQRSQGRYARQQQSAKKPTEQIASENVPATRAPGSQQVSLTGVSTETWQEFLDFLEAKEPSKALESIEGIRKENLALTVEQKTDLRRLEQIANLKIELANLKGQQTGQQSGTQTGPANKPQQQETQAEQPAPPAGGGPSVSSVRTNPFVAPQASVTEQQVKPVVTTETKPTRQGPLQQAWQNMPSVGQMAYQAFGSDPNVIQRPQVVSQTTEDKPVGQLKQAWRNLPSFSSALYQLGGGRAPDIINPKPETPVSVAQSQIQPAAASAQPQPAAISEEEWKDAKAILAAEPPSQKLVDNIEGFKKYAGLSDVQRGELEKIQQSVKAHLSTPSLQTPTPPQALPAQMPSNPFMAPKVVPKVQQPTSENPFSRPQPQRETMNENLWKQTKTNISKAIVAFPSQGLLDRIEEIKGAYALSREQLEWLNEQQRVIKGLIPISEEKWQEIRAALILASTQPSQQLVDQIEKHKNDPRFSDEQRNELMRLQQNIKARLVKTAPLTGRPIAPKSTEPGPLQKAWENLPSFRAFY